jgi:hypothetical protein
MRRVVRLLPLVLLACGTPGLGTLADDDGDGFTADVDCDDTDPDVNPGATERCDEGEVDEDCDGLVNADDPDAPTFSA